MFELFHMTPLDAFHQEPDHNYEVFHETVSQDDYLAYSPSEVEHDFSAFQPEPTGEHPPADSFDTESDHHRIEGEPTGVAEKKTNH